MAVTPPVSPTIERGPFSPLWPPLPCSQKRRASALPAQPDRHNRSPTAKAQEGSLVSSRRTKNRLGQILHSCTIDGDGRLNFQTAYLGQLIGALSEKRSDDPQHGASLSLPVEQPCQIGLSQRAASIFSAPDAKRALGLHFSTNP